MLPLQLRKICLLLYLSFQSESWRGITYHAGRLINRTTDTITIRLENQIHIGDTFEIKLSTGFPEARIDVLDMMTFIVTTEGIVEVY